MKRAGKWAKFTLFSLSSESDSESEHEDGGVVKGKTTDDLVAGNGVLEYEDVPDSPLPSKRTSSRFQEL